MANPLKEEKQLYAQIKKEKITMHPVLWNLFNHHIRNDTTIISMAVGEYALLPRWILKTASRVIKVLYRLSRLHGSPPQDLDLMADKTLKRIKNIDRFMKDMYKRTNPS